MSSRLFSNCFKISLVNFFKVTNCNFHISPRMETESWDTLAKKLPPPLTTDKYKGQDGRIGIFGGSLEYTGAPYFSAIASLKVGADLVHVFCPKEAATVIKSYSPELIVHPLLDDKEAVSKIKPWLERLHVILIGPGLGRDDNIFSVIADIIEICREKRKALVIDADGLFYIAKNPNVLRCFPAPGVILTPNGIEYARLLGSEDPRKNSKEASKKLFELWGENATIVVKGEEDLILTSHKNTSVCGGGSGRRCGGQGDLLGGALATFFAWSLDKKVDVPERDKPLVVSYAACKLIRECNKRVFTRKGRSMISTDMIEEIHGVFQDCFKK